MLAVCLSYMTLLCWEMFPLWPLFGEFFCFHQKLILNIIRSFSEVITFFIHFLRFIFFEKNWPGKNAAAWHLLSKLQNQKEKAICNSVHDTEALAGFGIRFRRSSVSLCDALFKFLSAELYQSGFLEHPQTPGKPTCSVLSLTFFLMSLSGGALHSLRVSGLLVGNFTFLVSIHNSSGSIEVYPITIFI